MHAIKSYKIILTLFPLTSVYDTLTSQNPWKHRYLPCFWNYWYFYAKTSRSKTNKIPVENPRAAQNDANIAKHRQILSPVRNDLRGVLHFKWGRHLPCACCATILNQWTDQGLVAFTIGQRSKGWQRDDFLNVAFPCGNSPKGRPGMTFARPPPWLSSLQVKFDDIQFFRRAAEKAEGLELWKSELDRIRIIERTGRCCSQDFGTHRRFCSNKAFLHCPPCVVLWLLVVNHQPWLIPNILDRLRATLTQLHCEDGASSLGLQKPSRWVCFTLGGYNWPCWVSWTMINRRIFNLTVSIQFHHQVAPVLADLDSSGFVRCSLSDEIEVYMAWCERSMEVFDGFRSMSAPRSLEGLFPSRDWSKFRPGDHWRGVF